jgi:hypothetical protein
MVGTRRRASCREFFKKFNILPLASEFLLSLSSFVKDIKKYQTNSDIHNISTRYRYNLNVPNANLSKYQKGIYYQKSESRYKKVLKMYLLAHSYSVGEFTTTKNSQLL